MVAFPDSVENIDFYVELTLAPNYHNVQRAHTSKTFGVRNKVSSYG